MLLSEKAKKASKKVIGTHQNEVELLLESESNDEVIYLLNQASLWFDVAWGSSDAAEFLSDKPSSLSAFSKAQEDNQKALDYLSSAKKLKKTLITQARVKEKYEAKKAALRKIKASTKI